MGQNEVLGRDFWIELLHLYDEYIRLGKTDAQTIAMLEQAGLLREGTLMGQKLMEEFPHLDFKSVEDLVRQGIREKIVEEIKKVPF
jgi:ribosomal 50S subunit-associated protein YjgA (DUF615 family)